MMKLKELILLIRAWPAVAVENVKKTLQSPHIQISIATGISILVMAYVSKRILPEPLTYLELAFPPFLMTIYEAVQKKHKDSRFCRTRYWVAGIVVATILVIARHLV